ncbi:TetR/AcrR family transcriptional regulator [Lactobacillus psittaci]|uniref:Transcriptional regulator n=1 Tax=Lactobacillus psittaci DSM 15354 TaxID=1122152 RepID=A0A0R1S2C4_9LACO|nr:TetR/AcrR family transcriptional regulator [Lactobacillus psittaci]KRL63293.1 transcriptional regulator [Lactobacillus psittaci DSM 15354]
MARKKEIRRQQILDVAYKLALRDGVKSLTARNIAQVGKFSTQPIYLEFSNMADLRKQVLRIMATNLRKEISSKAYIGKALVDLDLAYVEFAQEEYDAFKAMFTDGKLASKILSSTLMKLGIECFYKQYQNVDVDDEKIELVIMANWIAATGIASLVVNRVATFTQEQMVDVFEKQIEESLENKDLSYVKQNPMFIVAEE